MNKLNNFFSSWKRSSLFLSLFIGLSVIVSTAAASGGFKLSGFVSPVKTDLAKANAKESPVSPAADEINTQPTTTNFPVTAQSQNTESAGDLNNQATADVQDHQDNQIVTQADNSASSSDIQVAVVDTSAAGATSTNQNNNLISFNAQTLALHNKAGDCYVAYQGRVYNVSEDTVWSTCNYGIAGGADVTAGFPDAANYFTSFPLVGTYYDANYLANQTNNNQTASSTASGSNNTTTATSTSNAATTHKEGNGDDNYISNRTRSGRRDD
jgi:predicted heme/steroid binding protein